MEDQVVLLDYWVSAFAARVKIALVEKGVKHEIKEQNVFDKGPLLLQMNPVHKMIPVLIHNGKPICESLIILEYMDEVWHDRSPLLPSDPYQRSQARFWVDFIEKKVNPNRKMLWMEEGEKQEEAKRGLIESLRTLEGALGEKSYFGGETIGFVDVALVPFTSWFYTLEICGNFSIEAECPKIIAWMNRCMQKESVSMSLPDPRKVYDYVVEFKKKRLGRG